MPWSGNPAVMADLHGAIVVKSRILSPWWAVSLKIVMRKTGRIEMLKKTATDILTMQLSFDSSAAKA